MQESPEIPGALSVYGQLVALSDSLERTVTTETHGGIQMTRQDIRTLSQSLRRRARGTGQVTERQVWNVTADYYLGDRARYVNGVRALAVAEGLTVVP